ncbi:MAG: hypothetical protein ACR2Q3_14865 [Woeseiaceae bacterium]
MTVWISIIVVLLVLWLLARLDVRGSSNLPVRSWNIFIGPKPRDGESQVQFSLRKALVALVTTAVVTLPLLFVSAVPDEGADFSGNESIIDLAVFIICGPLAAMAFLTVVASLFSTMVSAIFRRRKIFDSETGAFIRR